MKRSLCFLLLVPVFIVGCGGGGGGAVAVTPSTFAGSWAGTWTSASLGQNGTSTITVASDGTVAGTVHNNTSNSNGTIAGSIDNSGNVTGSAQYPGQAATSLSGTLTLNGQGHLAGNLIQNVGGTNHGITYDLIKQ